MRKLVAIPTLIVNTDIGPCVVKVNDHAIEAVLLHIIGGWCQDRQARLILLPPHMAVTGSIVEATKGGEDE